MIFLIILIFLFFLIYLVSKNNEKKDKDNKNIKKLQEKKMKKSIAIHLINKMGFDNASIIIYNIILKTFHSQIDNQIRFMSELEQFIREEFDAASKVSGYPANFVKDLCDDENWYKGAMDEKTEYPIDEACGPQQTLHFFIIPMMFENPDLGVKLRCHIVEMLYEDYQVLLPQMLDLPISAFGLHDFKERRNKTIELLDEINVLIICLRNAGWSFRV